MKVRTTLIGGEKKMLVWNDLEADEKIKVYDKGVHITSREGLYNLLVNYRSGDMWAPQVGAGRGAETGAGILCRLHLEQSRTFQRRRSWPPRGQTPGGCQSIGQKKRSVGLPVTHLSHS